MFTTHLPSLLVNNVLNMRLAKPIQSYQIHFNKVLFIIAIIFLVNQIYLHCRTSTRPMVLAVALGRLASSSPKKARYAWNFPGNTLTSPRSLSTFCKAFVIQIMFAQRGLKPSNLGTMFNSSFFLRSYFTF